MITLKKLILPFVLLVALTGCGVNQELAAVKKSSIAYSALSAEDKQLADTLIKKVLDNEGLYTVVGSLKPISSVSNLSLKIARKDSLIKGNRNISDVNSADYKKLLQYQRVVSALQFGDLKFVMTPYKVSENGQRLMQINVYRQGLVDSLVNANREFFGQFGYAPGVSGDLLINTTEYEKKYDRFRSYGYLFGYPEHAVTFYVEASIIDDEKGTFVKRDFFQIPVFSGPKGHFVYAYPKGTIPGTLDEAIKARAEYALRNYEQARPVYQRPDGSLKAYELLMHLIKSGGRK